MSKSLPTGGSDYRPVSVDETDDMSTLIFDSATYVAQYFQRQPSDKSHVIVNASYSGVYCARLVAPYSRLGAIGVDCGIGMDGAGINGLWFYEGLAIAAAAADVRTVELGNGEDLYAHGLISRANQFADQLGVVKGLPVNEAAKLMRRSLGAAAKGTGPERWIVEQGDGDGNVVCLDSIADASSEDRDRNVLCTAGHTGRSVIGYIRKFQPRGFISSNGGPAKNGSGLVALWEFDSEIPGAAVDANSARMGDGRSTYFDGIIVACNEAARACGVAEGQTCKEAAHRMLSRGVPREGLSLPRRAG